ncbi:MAG: tetratricopeptide repeat protein [Planctomycetota bacterium]
MHSPADKKTIPTVSKGKDTQKEVKKVTRKPVTGWRLWLFRIVALTVIPAFLFLLLELSLRIVGYGFPSTAMVKCEVNGKEFYCDNVKFGWRFFPRNLARESSPFIFPAEKPEGTYRIFVQGASAAQGAPDAAFCFGRILHVMLHQRYPQANFEVINAAMPAINSHVVVEIAGDCARHHTDLFIVYLGNNEVVGPYGAGTVFSPFSGSQSLIRMGIALKATKLGQLITNLLESAGAGNAPKVWRGMKMFLEKQVRVDDTNLRIVYRHFQKNLQDMRRLACKSGVNIIFCTVPSNLKDSPPFASLHRPNLTDIEKKIWEELYQQGVTYESAGKYAEAVERYLKAAEIDDSYADLQFRLGRCYWAMGEYDKASERYIRARELDTLRFRADNRINEIIRNVARDRTAEGVYLLDAMRTFEKNSPHEIPGEELFYEHVHMNFHGNYLLATTICKQVEEILPEKIKRQNANHGLLLTESECAQRLAYNDLARYKIANEVLNKFIKKAPFTNQLYHKQQVRQLEEKIKVLKANITPESLKNAAAEYQRAIENEPSDRWLRWRYAFLLSENLGNYEAAAEQLRLIQQDWPYDYNAHTSHGLLLARLGAIEPAIAEYIKAIRIKPTCAKTHYYLGLAYQTKGQLDKAVKCYSITVRLQPNFIEAYDSLGGVLFRQGKLAEAVQVLRKGLLYAPGDVVLRSNMGILLEKQGLTAEAIKELQAALRIDPNSAKTQKVLKAILERKNQTTTAPQNK